MSAVPLPEPEEPDGSWVPGEDGDGEGLGQGLYVTLPAEEVALEGFAEDGRADTMTAGPLLATILEAIAGPDGQGLAELADDQLIGFMSAARRIESRMAWARMAGMAEFAGRTRRKGYGAADQIAFAFNMTPFAAGGQIGYACGVARRLPKTFTALAAGKVDPVHVRIIEENTSILSDEDAAIADEQLAQIAQEETYGRLRSAATKLVNKLDSEAVRKRKERARRDASVRSFREESGNAGITGREMPSVEVLASMQNVETRAQALRDAGVPGNWEELKVRATLDLLQGRDSRLTLGTQSEDADGPGDDGDPYRNDSPGDDGPGGNGGPGPATGPAGTGSGEGGRVGQPGADEGPSIRAMLNVIIPIGAIQGDTGPPGEVAGFGVLDHQETWDLAAAAGRNPDSRWCVTVVNPDGTAAAHGCAPGPRRWPPGQGPPESLRTGQLLQWLRIAKLDMVIRGPCDHSRCETRYRPSRKLQHLIKARNDTCTAPGCGRPAARCDLDHTDPHHAGGRTCECNLAPLCRHHHQCKQGEGWRLEQPEPGVLIWHTPAGRSYTTTPTQYPT
jgi:hypothetical protein